jgi:hypothetical protein
LTKEFQNLRTTEQTRVLDELNVLLKMFDVECRVHYSKGKPHNCKAYVWRATPFRVALMDGSVCAMFASFKQLRAYVHELTSIQPVAPAEETAYCTECENGGWVLSGYQGSHPPNFEECPSCYNPDNFPSP